MAKGKPKGVETDAEEQTPELIFDFSDFTRKKAKVLQALCDSLGIVTDACRKAGITPPTFYNWRRDDEAFAEAVEMINDVQIDFVEGKLLGNIRNGYETSILFYLKTKGKSRGYSQDEGHRAQSMPELPQITVNVMPLDESHNA